MEARYFYFTIYSARDLIDVRTFGEMKVYAKVSIAGMSGCTEVDLVNKTNPDWNTRFLFYVPEKDIVRGYVDAVIELFCKRSFSDDKYVGQLNLTMIKPFKKGECNLSVRRNDSNSNESFGTLKYSYELGDKILVVQDSSSPSENFSDMTGILMFGLERFYSSTEEPFLREARDVVNGGRSLFWPNPDFVLLLPIVEPDRLDSFPCPPGLSLRFVLLLYRRLNEDTRSARLSQMPHRLDKRSSSYDKYVGQLNLTLRPFYKGECNFSVHRNDSNRNESFGTLKFSHELGNKILVVQEESSSSENFSGIMTT
ncbi:hypothetical protein H5410_000094 [Solanum commersonii]|uniref:C2 domain-containing protein n=1 Tax=Solanum commersonii TaxID=4109 RepID=A0A9J6AVI8_SOLCO|nr:hypothetical protein H5410_000094 [Solanum commersonii]